MNRIALWIFGLILWLVHSFVRAEGISNGTRFVSPDGQYSIELEEIDRESHFKIMDIKTGHVDNSIVMPTVLLYLHWTTNSQFIVTVEHIAKGSYGRVIYSINGKWVDVKIEAPGEEMMDSTVVGLEIKGDYAHYRFAVRYVKNDGTPINYKFCDLDVRFKTGKTFNLKWTSISESKFVRSLTHNPSYVPPMAELQSNQ